ncbi:MAG: GTP cyclohydrolase II [Candidatus Altiarchaeota archaeon]
MVEHIASSKLPTDFGEFEIHAFRGVSGEEVVVLTKGDVSGDSVLLRIHSACMTGDVFHSRRCDCRQQLEKSMNLMEKDGRGIIIYLPGHEGRGIGILNKIRAYRLQDGGLDTVEANRRLGFDADLRDFSSIPGVLKHFGVKSVRLLTNNPKKIKGLDDSAIRITRESLEVKPNKTNRKYLKAKRDRMGHMLSEER